MKFNSLLNNFSAGEWSPKMRSRSDVQQYFNACEKLQNFIPQIQGGAFFRGGTERVLIGSTYEGQLSSTSAIFPWTFSSGDAYLLVANFGNPATEWFVYNIGTGVVSLLASSTTDVPVDPRNFMFTQLGDIIIMLDKEGGIEPIVMYYDGSFRMQKLNLYVDAQPGLAEYEAFPYRPIEANGSSVNLTASATTGAITLTASAAYFEPGMVDSYFRLTSGGTTGVVRITGYTNSTSVSAQVLVALPSAGPYGTAAGTAWEESAWSDYRGWPSSLTAYQGRMVYGKDSTIFGSRIGNVFDMMEVPFAQDPFFTDYPLDNSRPFTLTPSSSEASNIKALSSAKTLLINTDKFEIVAYGTQGALGPNDVSFESSTSFGAEAVQPVRVNNYTVFVERGGTKVRDVIFNFTEDQYKSSDLAFVSEHLIRREEYLDITDTRIRQLCAARRSNVMLVLNNVYDVCGVTLDRDYQINGWFDFQFGDNAKIRHMAACGENYDQFYFVVRRTDENGNFIHFIERLSPIYESSEFYVVAPDLIVPTHLDAWMKSGIGVPALTFSGFDHLPGKTVGVIADGFYIGTKVVSNAGVITLASEATTILAGVPYQGIIKTMPIELGAQVPGSPQGFVKRIDEVTIKFWNSFGAQYGHKESDMLDINFKLPSTPMNVPHPLVTDFRKLKFSSNFDVEAQVIVKQVRPWPCNVLAIISKGMLYD